ncbi:MAG: hypothetical protein KIS92_09250, partial [Planctomycetota bacterium]|nr:hypothetical protein [Planctomycetota bacterium]
KQPEMVQQRAPERLVVPPSREARLPEDEARAEPVCFQRVYKAETDLGIVGERGNLPVRRIDRETLRDVILYDPEHDRTIRWTTPERVTVLQITEPY